DRLDSVILGTLRASKIFLPVMSTAWTASSHCNQELIEFMKVGGEAHIVPIDLSEVADPPPPLASLLRPRLYRKAGERQFSVGEAEEQRIIESLANDIARKLQEMEISPDVTRLVADLRAATLDDVRTRCGTIRVLTMVQPIELGAIYTDVNIMENRAASSRK